MATWRGLGALLLGCLLALAAGCARKPAPVPAAGSGEALIADWETQGARDRALLLKRFDEPRRKAMALEFDAAEGRAQRDAGRRYPGNTERTAEAISVLTERYQGQVRARHGLSEGEMAALFEEAGRKGWAAP